MKNLRCSLSAFLLVVSCNSINAMAEAQEIALARAKTLFELAEMCLESFEYEKALKYLKEAEHQVVDKDTAMRARIYLGVICASGEEERAAARVKNLFEFAKMHLESKEYDKAREYFEEAADQFKDLEIAAKAWAQLGQMYFLGRGVQKDYRKALHYFGLLIEDRISSRLRDDLINELCTLDSGSFVELIHACSDGDFPDPLKRACSVLKQRYLWKFTFEQVSSLPGGMSNRKMLDIIAPLPGKERATCRGHEGKVTAICVSHDGKIVSGSDDTTVRVWDMKGKELAVCRGHKGKVNSIRLANDGTIVSGSDDATVRVWDMNGNNLAVCKGHEGSVTSLCITTDGKIVSRARDNSVRVWDMNGKELANFWELTRSINAVSVTKDGKIIVAGSSDGTVIVWHFQENKHAVCKGHQGPVMDVCITNDAKIVSISLDKTARVWDLYGNQLAVCRGHKEHIHTVCVTNDCRIVSGSYDGDMLVWDMKGDQIHHYYDVSSSSVTVTSEEKIISVAIDNQVLVREEMSSKSPLVVCTGHQDFVPSACVTKDGEIVSCSYDGTVRIWDMSLLDRFDNMDNNRARLVWEVLQSFYQHHTIDLNQLWKKIEDILE